jgi:hypothetical protein
MTESFSGRYEEIGMVSSAKSLFTWGRRRFGRGIG